MGITIGIRREDLDKRGEQRVALTPSLIPNLIHHGGKVIVQPGIHPSAGENKRAFSDQDYTDAGASLSEDLSGADLILGLKEVKAAALIPGKPHLFFSHTHKGQVKNRPLLAEMQRKGVTLIDYELITNQEEQRLLTAFTYFAGYAGMTDSLWTYGERMKQQGIDHPFSHIPQSIHAESLAQVHALVAAAGEQIKTHGTPQELPPFIAVFLGNGKTSTGAQEIYDLLPVEEITLDQLSHVYESGSRNRVYKLVLEVADMFRLKVDAPFGEELQDRQVFYKTYRREPQHFESNLEYVFPYASMLMNCITWGPEYPRLLSRDQAAEWYAQRQTVEVIGDITCDPEGSIQFSQETWIDQPVFVYDPASRVSTLGMEGDGIAVMAVTNLPCEFSADASARFASELAPLHDALLKADWQAEDFEDSGLPPELAKATILWQGKLTPDFAYMAEYVG